jgi:hypothetical protein
MSSKLIISISVLAALSGFALPPVASASPELGETVFSESLTRLATGTSIRATNLGHASMTDANGNILVTCDTVQLDGTLNTNSGTLIEATISTATFKGTGTSGACTGFFGSNATVTTNIGNGVPWCFTAGGKLNPDAFQLRGNSCANASRSLTFVLDTTFGQCKYERFGPLNGTFTTDTSGQIATTTAVKQEFPAEPGNPFGCPSVFYFDLTLQWETTSGAPLYIR